MSRSLGNSSVTDGTPYRLLIVEDNAADVLFLKRALREDGVNADIDVANDGDVAIDYLENCPDGQAPNLVIIDINLPKRDGIEVLRKCRFRPVLAETKTLVLTSSDASSDQSHADTLGADAYIRKPRDLSEFARIVATVRSLLKKNRAE